jgi:hypothetical protein
LVSPGSNLPPLPTAGSAMDGGGGANRSGNNDAARRRRFDKSAVAGQGQGDTSVQCLVPPGGRNGAMVALLGPPRGTMVVRRPPTLLREVWRPDGACLICDNGNWRVSPAVKPCYCCWRPTIVWLRRSACWSGVSSGGGDDDSEAKLQRWTVECCTRDVASAEVAARVVLASYGEWWQWGSWLRAKALTRLDLVDWQRRPRESLSLLRVPFGSDNPTT